MLMPIRCISCGRLVADKWEEYDSRVKKGEKPKDVLDDLGVESYCCRSLFLTTVDLTDKIAIYKNRTVPRPAEVDASERVLKVPAVEKINSADSEDDQKEE